MNKNNIIGFLLIAVVLIGFSWYNQPSAEEQRTAFVQDSIAKAKHAEMEKASKAAAAKRQTNAKAKVEADSTALFYSALKGQAKKIVLKNEKVELTLNTKGATVEKAVIKGYVGHNLQVKDGSADAKDVTLFDGNDQSLKFMLEAKEANIITSDLYFTPSNVTDKSVTMTAVAGEGKTLTLTYTLGNDYMLHMSLQANGMAGLFSPNYNKMDVDWSDKARLPKNRERHSFRTPSPRLNMPRWKRPARLPLLSARLMPKQRLRQTQPPSSIRHSKARLRRLY
jgi:YidC/Oxa1 family membrane protein insertase